MFYTRKEYEILEKYEKNLWTAKAADFVRIENRTALTEMDEVFKKHFGNSGLLGGCSRCVLRDIKRLAAEYFKDKKAYEQLEPKEEVIETQEVKKTTSRKATSKPKKKKEE